MGAGCSKKEGASLEKGNNGDSSWTFGDYIHTRGGSSQDVSTGGANNDTFVAVDVSTSVNDGAYGAYSGSSVIYSFRKIFGAGTYTLTSN